MRAMTVVSRLASASFASTARVDRARRSQNFSFASIDAVRVERALATTCARRRVSRGRRDEDSTSAARARRARVAGRRVFVSRRGFVTYTTRSNARVVSHENEQIRSAPRASVGRSVGRPGRWPQSRAGVRRRRERGRRRGRPWVATARAMSAPTLTNMLDARVSVITNDGRHIVGTLRGFDQVTNVILEDCAERVYSSESGVEEAPLGVYMIRGDNVCVNARRRRRGGRGIEWTEDARARSNARDAKD
jgi:U6 snRNA-associated Sm-like protein LSm8